MGPPPLLAVIQQEWCPLCSSEEVCVCAPDPPPIRSACTTTCDMHPAPRTHRYDGQVFVKPPEILARDRLVGTYEVKPVLERLKRTLLLTGGALLATSAALVAVNSVAVDEGEGEGRTRVSFFFSPSGGGEEGSALGGGGGGVLGYGGGKKG